MWQQGMWSCGSGSCSRDAAFRWSRFSWLFSSKPGRRWATNTQLRCSCFPRSQKLCEIIDIGGFQLQRCWISRYTAVGNLYTIFGSYFTNQIWKIPSFPASCNWASSHYTVGGVHTASLHLQEQRGFLGADAHLLPMTLAHPLPKWNPWSVFTPGSGSLVPPESNLHGCSSSESAFLTPG